jgi:hypothetical protein
MKNAGLVLGYTRTGKPVFAPTRGAPDTNNVDVFLRTKSKFVGWTRGDHMDASNLLMERGEKLAASEDTGDRKRGRWHTNWSSVHWDIGGRWTSPEADTYKRGGS